MKWIAFGIAAITLLASGVIFRQSSSQEATSIRISEVPSQITPTVEEANDEPKTPRSDLVSANVKSIVEDVESWRLRYWTKEQLAANDKLRAGTEPLTDIEKADAFAYEIMRRHMIVMCNERYGPHQLAPSDKVKNLLLSNEADRQIWLETLLSYDRNTLIAAIDVLAPKYFDEEGKRIIAEAWRKMYHIGVHQDRAKVLFHMITNILKSIYADRTLNDGTYLGYVALHNELKPMSSFSQRMLNEAYANGINVEQKRNDALDELANTKRTMPPVWLFSFSFSDAEDAAEREIREQRLLRDSFRCERWEMKYTDPVRFEEQLERYNDVDARAPVY